MVSHVDDRRIAGQPRQGILHRLMQRGVKALNTVHGRHLAATLCSHFQPGQPACQTATLEAIQAWQGSTGGKRQLARPGLAQFEPGGHGALGAAVCRTEGKFCDSGGHKVSRCIVAVENN